MKAKKTLWILLVALSCFTQSPALRAGKKEITNIGDHSASKGDAKPKPDGHDTISRAFFTGAEADLMLRSNTAADDPLLAASQAIAAARARIQSSRKCQKFFHDEGVNKLDRTFYTLQFIPNNNIAAEVEDDTVVLNRGAESAFMKPPLGFAGQKSAVEIRAFYILHELGHELSQFTKFTVDHSVAKADNQSRHQRNDELLLQNCY